MWLVWSREQAIGEEEQSALYAQCTSRLYCFSQITVEGGSPGAPPTAVIVLPSSETVYTEDEITLPFNFSTRRKL